MQKTETMTLKIDDTVVIPYPENELAELKELLERDGMLKTIAANSEVSIPTIYKIVDTGLGQKGKIENIRNVVKLFNKQYPAPPKRA